MSGLVLDASLAAAWLLDDETWPGASESLDRVRNEGGLVPELWQSEVGNALVVAERRGRLPAGGALARLTSLRRLPITTDQFPDLDAAIDLAMVHGLSLYDAAYVELATRLDLPLATLDRNLARAALAEGLDVTPTPQGGRGGRNNVS